MVAIDIRHRAQLCRLQARGGSYRPRLTTSSRVVSHQAKRLSVSGSESAGIVVDDDPDAVMTAAEPSPSPPCGLSADANTDIPLSPGGFFQTVSHLAERRSNGLDTVRIVVDTDRVSMARSSSQSPSCGPHCQERIGDEGIGFSGLHCLERVDDEDDDDGSNGGVRAQSSIAFLSSDSFIDLCTELAAKYSPPSTSPQCFDECLQVHQSNQAAQLIRQNGLVVLPNRKSSSSSSSSSLVPSKAKSADHYKQTWRGSHVRRSLGELCDGEVNDRDDEINAEKLIETAQQQLSLLSTTTPTSDAVAKGVMTPPNCRQICAADEQPPRKKHAIETFGSAAHRAAA